VETLLYSVIHSSIGPLTLGVSKRGLVWLGFGKHRPDRLGGTRVAWEESPGEVEPYARELEEYLAGRRREFSLPLDLRGTDFQKKCWQALLAIPYGETRTYAEIAKSVGRPQAFRAVGMANHWNPVAIIVPCHRVIETSGGLGGYGGGLDLKEKLLKLEGVRLGLFA
jgi:methylated-DNA-[protein]-cysteine S-methyltransferase